MFIASGAQAGIISARMHAQQPQALMRVKVKRAGHEVARGHDRWHIDCVDAMTLPAGTRESTPEPTSDSLGSAWRRAGQRQELRDGRVFGVQASSV